LPTTNTTDNNAAVEIVKLRSANSCLKEQIERMGVFERRRDEEMESFRIEIERLHGENVGLKEEVEVLKGELREVREREKEVDKITALARMTDRSEIKVHELERLARKVVTLESELTSLRKIQQE